MCECVNVWMCKALWGPWGRVKSKYKYRPFLPFYHIDENLTAERNLNFKKKKSPAFNLKHLQKADCQWCDIILFKGSETEEAVKNERMKAQCEECEETTETWRKFNRG